MTDRFYKSLVVSVKRALGKRDFDEAERLTSRLLDAYPGEAASHGFQLELLLERGRLEEAGRLAERLLVQFPGSAGIWFGAGLAAYRLKTYSEARRRFEESEKLFSSRKTRRWLAKTLTNMGRFDDAEALLTGLVESDPYCHGDLAWLYERQGDTERAKKAAALHLNRFPNDKRIQAQMVRLDAREIDATEVIEQVDFLVALGETIPDSLVSRYVSALAAVGNSEAVRQFISKEKRFLGQRVILDLAWTCHRLQLHDMAYDLFVLVWEKHLFDFKLLNTLDFSAKCTGRALELAGLYEPLAPRQPALYTRIKKLRRAIKTEGDTQG